MGPLLVDWTAYRATFETEAAKILGHPVKVSGTADATLLPTPALTFTNVVIGEDPENPLMTVGRFDIEVELFPLLSGEIRVTQMRLDAPRLNVRLNDDAEFEWIATGTDTPVDPKRVVLDKVDIAGGSIRLIDPRRPAPIEVDDINGTLDARSLIGPYRFDGGLVLEGERLMLKAATGEKDPAGRTVVKATINPASQPLTIGFDGALETSGGNPALAGMLKLERVKDESAEGATPWSVEAKLEIDARRARANDLKLNYGPEDRPFAISGAATVDFSAEPFFDAVLSARQIDLDRTLGEGPDKPVAFSAVLAALGQAVEQLPAPPLPGRIGFDIPGIVVGGSIIQNVALDVSAGTTPGWIIDALEAELPGKSEFAATGQVDVASGARFEGSVALASEQPATLVAWWYPARGRSTLEPFSARAQSQLSSGGLTLSNLQVEIGDASLGGELSFEPARSNLKPRLELTLGTDEVAAATIAPVFDLLAGDDGSASALEGADIIVKLSAGALKAGEAVASGVDIAASLIDGTLAVERLFVRDLAGARLSASGTVKDIGTAPDGSMQAEIAAEGLSGVLALVEAIAPNAEVTRLLRTAAPVLSPLNARATITAARRGEGTDAKLAIEGTAGGTTIDSRLAFEGRVDRWHEASIDLDGRLTGPDGTRLMRQLGLDVADLAVPAAGSVTLTAKGRPADGLTLGLDASLGGTTLGLVGELTLPAVDPATGRFETRLASDDVGPILALGGDLLAGIYASTAVDLTATTELAGAKLGFRDLTGTVDGAAIKGDLALDLAAEIPAASGSLSVSAASLDGLLEAALGPGTLAMPIVASRSPWPEAPFGVGSLDALDTDIALEVDRLAAPGGLELTGFRTALRATAAGVGFDSIEAGVAGGSLKGNLLIKKDLEGEAAVSSTLRLEDVAAEELVWQRAGRAVATGRLGLDLEFTASGRTVAGLVSSLAGGGSLRLQDGVIRSMNPQAFGAVLRAFDAGQDLPDDRIRELYERNIDAGDLAFEALESTFTLTAGTLRAPSITVTGAGGETSGSAMIDLAAETLESDWKLVAPVAGTPAAEGGAPQVGLLFRGPISAPERQIDVTALSSYLSIRSFERETERVLVLQADILERELLARTILRDKEGEARRIAAEEAARIAAEAAAEAARLDAEAEAEAAREAAEAANPDGPDLPETPRRRENAPVSADDDFARQIEERLRQGNGTTAPDDGPQPGEPLPDLPGVNIDPPPGGFAPGPLDLTPPGL